MVLDLVSLKPTLFVFDHAFILLISMLAKFSASLTDSPLMINRRSSANTTAVVRLVKLRFSIVLYSMFQRHGAQHEPWGHPLVPLSVSGSCL